MYRIGNGRNKLFVFVFVFESADRQLAGQTLCNYGPPPPPPSIPAYLHWGGRGSLPHAPAHNNTYTKQHTTQLQSNSLHKVIDAPIFLFGAYTLWF